MNRLTAMGLLCAVVAACTSTGSAPPRGLAVRESSDQRLVATYVADHGVRLDLVATGSQAGLAVEVRRGGELVLDAPDFEHMMIGGRNAYAALTSDRDAAATLVAYGTTQDGAQLLELVSALDAAQLTTATGKLATGILDLARTSLIGEPFCTDAIDCYNMWVNCRAPCYQLQGADRQACFRECERARDQCIHDVCGSG